jgi:hypothetical protein
VPQQELPETEAWERLVYQCPECGAGDPKVSVTGRRLSGTCTECDERQVFHAVPVDLSRTEALAELLVRSMNSVPTIARADRDRDIIRVYVKSGGVHLMNFTGNVDIEIHEVGDRDTYESHDDEWPDGAEAFCNGYVRGLRDDWNGYAFPTHTTERDGAHLREDMSEDLRRLGELAGILD